MTDSIAYILLAIIFFFFIAEFFGRSRHIGRWWSFALLLCGFIPGLIAILLSPSANNKPTSGGNSYKIGGYVCLFFSGLNLLVLISTSGKLGQLFPVFLVSGIYLLLLSKGLIINNEPKYYFNSLAKDTIKDNYQLKNPNSKESIINSLYELNKKGLISDEELNIKLEKYHNNIANEDLYKTKEYLNLSLLLNNNVISEIEFNEKLVILRNKHYKKLNTNEYNALLDLYEKGILNKEEFEEKINKI